MNKDVKNVRQISSSCCFLNNFITFPKHYLYLFISSGCQMVNAKWMNEFKHHIQSLNVNNRMEYWTIEWRVGGWFSSMSNIVSQKYEQQVTKVEWIIPRKKEKIILPSIPCIHPYPHCTLSFSIVYKKLTNISLFFPKSPSGRQRHNRATTGLEQSDICLVSASHTWRILLNFRKVNWWGYYVNCA